MVAPQEAHSADDGHNHDEISEVEDSGWKSDWHLLLALFILCVVDIGIWL